MKTKDQESEGGAEDVLSSDLVLTRNSLVTTDEVEDSRRDGAVGNVIKGGKTISGRWSAVMPVPGAISVSTLSNEERALLALTDGRRSVADLIRLSGMPGDVARKHLRTLRDRAILVADATGPKADSSQVTANEGIDAATNAATSGLPGAPQGEGEGEGVTDGSSALTRAIDEYLDFAASALTSAAAAEEASKLAVANMDPNASSAGVRVDGTAITTMSGFAPTVVSPRPAEAAAKGSGTFGPPTPAGGVPGTGASGPGSGPVAAGQGQRTFKPNVTAFWIPSMGDMLPNPLAGSVPPPTNAPAGAVRPGGNVNVSYAKVLGALAGGDGNPRSSEAPTVVPGSPLPGVAGADGVPSEVAPSQVSAPIPFRVGNYEVATRIAQGGMGSIYVCRRAGDAGFQRLYTLKVVRQHSAKRDEAVRSFKREAHVGSLVSHPNLQTVLDTGSYKDQPFLVLDYIEGTSLSELLADDRRAPVPVMVSILLDVLRGLEHAHQLVDDKTARLGLVHGDVSPQNVLVGVDGAARLTDFGSATFTGEGRPADPKWIATGKPAYMAPEQLRAEPLDARTDVFAVGAMMWGVLTGQKLFAADSYDETIIKVLRKKIPPPSSFGAPPFLDDICLKALSRAREGRYNSAEEMAKELARVASSHNVLASPAEVGQWVRRESGEGLSEQRRRIQFMFATGARGPSAGAKARPHANVPQRGSAGGRVGPATIVLDSLQRNVSTPPVGANKTLPSRTVFLPAVRRPQKATFWGTWNVVIVSALLALPVTLTIGYFVSNLFVSHAPPAPAPRGAADSADAATSQ
ncbi:MAG: protein kinase [Myxococcales bacterium]